MDAFEEWFAEQLRTRESGPNHEDAFRAGMRAAAEVAAIHWGVALNPDELRAAILAEADKP